MDQYHEEIAAFSFMMILVTSKRQTTFTSFYIFTKTAKPSFIYLVIVDIWYKPLSSRPSLASLFIMASFMGTSIT